MPDSPTLRLARIWKDFMTGDANWEACTERVTQLVRDLEAAEAEPAVLGAGMGHAPMPTRDDLARVLPRTITRAQYRWALEEVERVAAEEATPDNAVARIVQVFGLTVEDA